MLKKISKLIEQQHPLTTYNNGGTTFHSHLGEIRELILEGGKKGGKGRRKEGDSM